MLKKLLVFVIVVCIFTCTIPAFAADASQPSSWAKSQVEEAIKLGIAPEAIQSNYQQAITREEFASLFVTTVFAWQKENIFETEYYGSQPITKEMYLENVTVTDYNFTDVTNEDVKLAYMMGFVSGTSKTLFSPDKPITRQEGAVMLVNYFQMQLDSEYDNLGKLSDLNQAASWAKDPVSFAYFANFFEGTSGSRGDGSKVKIDPLGKFTREQAIIIALKIFKNYGMPVKIRGVIDYKDDATKFKWEVGSNSVKAIKFKDGLTLDSSDEVYASWYNYNSTNTYICATAEQMYAGANTGAHIFYSYFSKEMFATAAKGTNAVFDLGWAEYEMLGKDFIFEYRLKNNGVHDWYTYGGSKKIEITHKRVR
jgi:hypothetical protein